MHNVAIPAPVYVRAPGYTLGELRPLAEVPELGRDKGALKSFLDVGLVHFSHSDLSPPAMAAKAIAATFRASGVAPESVDAFIYASDTPPLGRYYGEELRTLCCEAGLARAYPIGLFLSECANQQLSLRMAADLINADRADRVLVVTADRVVENYPRAWTGVTVLGDGACSFLVERARPDEGYELCATAHSTNPELWRLDLNTQLLDFFKGVIEQLRAVASDALRCGGITQGDVDHLIVSNYNLSVIRTFAQTTGFTMERVYTKNLPRFAHTFASDSFINLADLTAEGGMRPGQHVLMLSSGTTTWGGSLLRRL
jgi:3-oxoacyl-[acyl-carrier-protein] synthase III